MAFYVKNQFFYDFPLFIAGNSSKSAAGMGTKGEHLAKLEDISFLPKDISKEWENLNPKFWSGPTIWAESAIKAIRLCKKNKMMENFNFIRLYAACRVFNPSYNYLTEQAESSYIELINMKRSNFRFKYNLEILKIWKLRFMALFKNSLNILKIKIGIGKANHSNILNVFDAVEVLLSNKK
jgi:hypothetical protein